MLITSALSKNSALTAAGVSKNINVTHQSLAILRKNMANLPYDLDLRKNFKTLKEYLIQGKD